MNSELRSELNILLDTLEKDSRGSLTVDQVMNILRSDSMDNSLNPISANSMQRSILNLTSKSNIEYYRQISSHRKIIGPIIFQFRRIVRRLLRFLVEPIVMDISDYNKLVANSINNINSNIDNITNKFNEINNDINKIQQEISEFKNNVDYQLDNIDNNTKIKNLSGLINIIDEKITGIQSSVSGQFIDIWSRLDNYDLNLIRQVDIKKNNTLEMKKIASNIISNNDIYEEIDYFEFENHFRGTQYNIKKQMESRYLKYFQDKNNVLDIGCGRGEFLECLKSNGINSRGIDTYNDYVNLCNIKGLQVTQNDALNEINSLEDNSLDGIMISQVVEHMETNYLFTLCKLIYSKLKNNGILIIETPNPMGLAIYRNWFFTDPTHIKPVHPKTLEYMLRKSGFSNIRIEFLEDSKEGEHIIPLKIPNEIEGINIHEFNESLSKLDEIIYSCQDYAVIVKK